MFFLMKQSLLLVIFVITFLSSSSLTFSDSPLNYPSEVTSTVVITTSNSSSSGKALSGGVFSTLNYDGYIGGWSEWKTWLVVIGGISVSLVPICCYCLYPYCIALSHRGEPDNRFQNYSTQQHQYTSVEAEYPGQAKMV